MNTGWVYKESERGCFTVGYENLQGEWIADSDWPTRGEAAERVHYLNGGGSMRWGNRNTRDAHEQTR